MMLNIMQRHVYVVVPDGSLYCSSLPAYIVRRIADISVTAGKTIRTEQVSDEDGETHGPCID